MKASRLVPCLVALSALACGGGDDGDDDDDYDYYYDEYLGDTVVTATYWDDWASSTVYAMTDPIEEPHVYDDSTSLTVSREAPAADLEAVAVRVADSMPLYFTPSDCASIERIRSELTVTMAECRALFSASAIDGTLRVSFADEAGQIAFKAASENLRIDGAVAELSMDGEYNGASGAKTVRYNSRRSLDLGERSYSGEFDSALTWTAGSNCVAGDATGQTVTASRTFDVSIDGYTRCAGECPTGGVVTMSDDIATITLTFDGTAEARLERNNGETGRVALDCD